MLDAAVAGLSIRASTGATVHDLPEELVASILSHFADSSSVDLDTLKACSLVHSSWRDPAQRLLWECGAELYTEEDVRSWTRTRARRRCGPREIAVHAYGDRKELKRLLDGCAGVRWLMLATPNRDIDPKILAHPALEELSTLIVQGWLMQSPPTLAFPFRLRSLVVADLSFKSRYLASFLATVAKSDSSSLRSISLPACSKHAHPEVAASLLHFAPSLDHLGLSIGTTDDATPYGDLLDACSALNSLECTSLPVPLLDHLPPSLAILATTEDAQHISVAALGAALERLPSSFTPLFTQTMLLPTRLLRPAALRRATARPHVRSLSLASHRTVAPAPPGSHPFPVLPTLVDPLSTTFEERAAQMRDKEDELRAMWGRVHEGGGEKARERVRKQGKMLVRERIDALLDPFSPFLELSSLAAEGMYDGKVPGAGMVTGIGRVNGVECVVVANDATVKGGSYHPITVKKHLRAQEIAAQNRLPCIYLVESGGAALPFQKDVFPDREHFGRIFYNMARMSADGIPQLAVVHGISVAGGAYVPAMADENIIVANQGSIFLAGPPLVKAALGEEVDSETLGGGAMHARESGVVDHLAVSDEHAIALARQAVAGLAHAGGASASAGGGLLEQADEPLYDPQELGGITGTNLKKSWDMREVIARTVDGSRFAEWKREWGETVVTGFAHVHGHQVGIIANNGVLLSPSALKATQFIQLCEQRGVPLVFLVNISGFMVGTAAEKGGIAKNGAKLVRAVAATSCPKITINVGGSYGAGNYGMSGRAYSPHFLFSWPSSRVAVMGPDQLSSVMATVSSDPSKTEQLREQIEKESEAVFGSARLWDDGIILPSHTRHVLGLALGVVNKAWKPEQRKKVGNFGVFRM
ncbi:uncharacterized protein JCM10292_004072 [Rhodotorula paludigena]|uniref:uncharacterized protein n=1 Tax=Rhodotorula paludigena TaxID=86838 RepID=UPI00317F417E